MKRVRIFALIFSMATVVGTAQKPVSPRPVGGKPAEPAPQAGLVVTKSLSNIKNNIEVHQGPGGKLTCLNVNPPHAPCDKDQVEALGKRISDRVAQAHSSHSSKSGILQEPLVRSIALAKPDGTLTCIATDGKPCTGAHVTELNNAVAAMKAESEPKPAAAK